MITSAQYFGTHIGSPEVTDGVRQAFSGLAEKVNKVLDKAAADGVKVRINPHTGCQVAGNGNGGFRESGSTVGAAKSKHKTGNAVDVYDPYRELAKWVWKNRAFVEGLGLCIERSEWTPSWVHFQDVPPASGVFAFIPSNDPPLIAALPEQSQSEGAA